MSAFETGYQSLSGYHDGDGVESLPFPAPDEATKTKWNHVRNLDEFFSRVYKYHQKRGFMCILLGDVLDICQFLFVMTLTSFLIECVDYAVLFGDKDVPHPHTSHGQTNHTKVTISDCIKSCSIHSFHSLTLLGLVIAGSFWIFRIVKVMYHLMMYMEIRSFYCSVLKVSSSDLHNMTWHEVQARLIEVQKEHQMCIHKSELTQLDIYHRILRFKNYTAAMVNKNVLPVKFDLPFIGRYVFITAGYRYNLDMILFWGPWAPFANSYQLKEDFKNTHKRRDLADQLAKKIFYIGIANFVLCPVILLWQILYSFYNYAEMIKREPGFFGMRAWSHYASIYLRHFNELDHEFSTRLSRGYKAASRYMTLFMSPWTTVFAKSVSFFCGSILSVLVILTVIDEDVLTVEHVLTVMTVLAAAVTILRQFIPDEHLIWCPEKLLTTVLSHIHYMPDHWKGNAHKWQTRDEFSRLFQYKFVHLLEELLSPIVTPFILCFVLKNRSLEIVDFFRNFTVDVIGVGDVCSFSLMNVRRHGNPQWFEPTKMNSTATQVNNRSQSEPADDGKTELSLMHFHVTNPDWTPPEDCSLFLKEVKDQAQKEAALVVNGVTDPQDTALFNSLLSLSSAGPGVGQSYTYNSMLTSVNQSVAPIGRSGIASDHPSFASRPPMQLARGAGVYQNDGPLTASNGVLNSLISSPNGASMIESTVGLGANGPFPSEAMQRELAVTDMGLSAVYLHELHFRKKHPSMDASGFSLHRRHFPENDNQYALHDLSGDHDSPVAMAPPSFPLPGSSGIPHSSNDRSPFLPRGQYDNEESVFAETHAVADLQPISSISPSELADLQENDDSRYSFRLPGDDGDDHHVNSDDETMSVPIRVPFLQNLNVNPSENPRTHSPLDDIFLRI